MRNIRNMGEMVEVLDAINGATFVGLTTMTEARMLKRGNPLAGHSVMKVSKMVMQFGYCYENAVNNRIEGLGHEREFVAAPLQWGEWLIPNKVITHKQSLYARFYTIANDCPPQVAYLVDGRMATEQEISIIKAFAPANYSNRQAEVGLTEHQVQPRDFKFSSILEMRVNDEEYEVSIKEVVTATA